MNFDGINIPPGTDDEVFWEILRDDFPCIDSAVKASKNGFPILLFILAIKEKKKGYRFYIFSSVLSKLYYVTDKDIEMKMAKKLSQYKNEVIKDLRDRKQIKKKVVDIGKILFDEFIPEEIKYMLRNKLKQESDKLEWGVWIYSDVDDFNPIWEWLYTSQKPSTVANQKGTKKISLRSITEYFHKQESENNEENGFFWGDKFFLSRVPRKYEFHELKFKIKNLAMLQHRACAYSGRDMSCLSNSCSISPNTIELNEWDKLKNLNDYDCIHVAAHRKTFKKSGYKDFVEGALEYSGNNNPLDDSGTKKPYFLFLNICECNSDIRLKFIDIISPKTWIDTSLGVKKNFVSTCKFSKYFYNEFCGEGKNVAEAATKAREKIKNGYLFCRLDINKELELDLNSETITDRLKSVFKDNGIILSKKAYCETEKNNSWKIIDIKEIYIITKENNKIIIYKSQNGGDLCNGFWRFAYIVNGNPYTKVI
jgi:hypothetical protein